MKSLKKTLLSLFFVALGFSLFAQIGVRAGITLPNQSFEQDGVDLSLDPNLGLVLAILAELPISQNFVIQPELAFVQKGAKLKIDFFGMTEESKVRVNHVEIPVLAKYKFGTDAVVAYLAAGPTFGYAISASEEFDGEKESFEDEDWDGYNRFEIGANAGGGIGIPMGVGQIFLDVRYLFSLTNLTDEEDVTARNKGVGISIGYSTALR